MDTGLRFMLSNEAGSLIDTQMASRTQLPQAFRSWMIQEGGRVHHMVFGVVWDMPAQEMLLSANGIIPANLWISAALTDAEMATPSRGGCARDRPMAFSPIRSVDSQVSRLADLMGVDIRLLTANRPPFPLFYQHIRDPNIFVELVVDCGGCL
jgi:hypothetical protein